MVAASRQFRSTAQAFQEQSADRTSWAQRGRELVRFDTTSTGTLITPQIHFTYMYEHSPYFSFGVELLEGTLTDENIPITSAGVASWLTMTLPRGMLVYRGATLWAAVTSEAQFGLGWTFSFEGIVYRSREFIG
jgi:hypothetical protein